MHQNDEQSTIAGRYAVIRRIGIGGMAEVYLAQDQRLGRQVALKILSARYAEQPPFVERFQREAQAAAALDHPNIVPIYDWGATDKTYYIAMGYVDGTTLKDHIGAADSADVGRHCRMITAIASALHAAHERGIIHRDVKPQNILIDAEGNPQLTDFGIARAIGESQLTESKVVLGTASYMAPEQANRSTIDARTDMYSLGVVAFELLTGRLPFVGESPVEIIMQHTSATPPAMREINPIIPVEVERVVLKALNKDPNERYRTAQEMAQAFADPAGLAPEQRTTLITETAATVPAKHPVGRKTSLVSEQPRKDTRRRELGSRFPAMLSIATFSIAAIVVVLLIVQPFGNNENLNSIDTSTEIESQGDQTNESQESTDLLENEVPETGDITEPSDTNEPDTESNQEVPQDTAAEPEPQENDVESEQSISGATGEIECAGEFSAVNASSVRVLPGASCVMNGGTSASDIVVEPGGSFQASGFSVDGNINAAESSSLVLDNGSFVDGNIEFERGGSATIRNSRVTGNLIIENTSGTNLIESNSVDGNLIYSGNRGTATVQNNQVDGNLNCGGNAEPPVGGGNIVNGNKEGQCADL